MKHTIIQCAQGSDSPEWIAARLGRVTGSIADILFAQGKTKGTESTQRINLRYALAEERITGQAKAFEFVSKAMKHGTEQEPYARMAYEGERDECVIQTGFIRCEDVMAGCSLDGHIAQAGRIVGINEIKCPMLKTHIFYWKAGTLPADYRWQVAHNLLCTDAEWCDFISYRPGFRLFVLRVHARDLPLEEYQVALTKFLKEVDECEAEIRSYAA